MNTFFVVEKNQKYILRSKTYPKEKTIGAVPPLLRSFEVENFLKNLAELHFS